jgi:hypothetical protein
MMILALAVVGFSLSAQAITIDVNNQGMLHASLTPTSKTDIDRIPSFHSNRRSNDCLRVDILLQEQRNHHPSSSIWTAPISTILLVGERCNGTSVIMTLTLALTDLDHSGAP